MKITGPHLCSAFGAPAAAVTSSRYTSGMPSLTRLGKHGAKTRTIQRSQGQTCSPGQWSRGTAHTTGKLESHPMHLTSLLFLHPEMGAPESVRSTERPSLKSMPFQPGQQKHTSQCDVSKAKNSSPFSDFIGATTAQSFLQSSGQVSTPGPGQSREEDTGAT